MSDAFPPAPANTGNARPTGHSLWFTALILAGMLTGAALGDGLFRAYDRNVPEAWLAAFSIIGGTVFIGLLKMVVVPLVATSVILGVASIGDARSLGRIGLASLAYFVGTMSIAAALGLGLVVWAQPGDPNGDGSGIGAAVVQRGESDYDRMRSAHTETVGGQGIGGAMRSILEKTVSNPIGAAASGDLLPVIAFSLLIGAALAAMGTSAAATLVVIEGVYAATMIVVRWILLLAPVGVLCLVAGTTARIGLAELFGPLLRYVLVVAAGFLAHGFLVLPAILRLLGRVHPYRFLHQMRAAVMTAFATCSSSAALPVSLQSAELEGGVSRRAARFVIPLGATVNMNGTALYEAVTVVFLFQCYGIPLGAQELMVVTMTSVLAAIGAAGIPSAGLVTMFIVVQAVNGSLGGDKTLPLAAVGIVFGIDRPLDMLRTTMNVWGDAVGAKILTRWFPDPPSGA